MSGEKKEETPSGVVKPRLLPGSGVVPGHHPDVSVSAFAFYPAIGHGAGFRVVTEDKLRSRIR